MDADVIEQCLKCRISRADPAAPSFGAVKVFI